MASCSPIALTVVVAITRRRSSYIFSIWPHRVPGNSTFCTSFGLAHRAGQRPNIALFELDKSSPLKAAWQQHGTVADAYQSTNCMADRLKHAPHFPVSTFRYRYAVPAISTFASTGLNRSKMRNAIIQAYTFKQAFFLFQSQRTQYTHSVFPFKAEPWMHQAICKLAGTRQQKQALGVQIETAHRLPLPLKQSRQASKNGGPILRIVMGYHLASRLVVRDHARRRGFNAKTNRLPIDLDSITKLDALADVCRLGIDRYATFKN